ncbi:MAG: hypothetical protein Q7R83_02085 [bacterium]|nr:hypothetical protein [bacterium]
MGKPGFQGIPSGVWNDVYADRGGVPNTDGDLGRWSRTLWEFERQINEGSICSQAARRRVAELMIELMQGSAEQKLMDRALERSKGESPFDQARALLAFCPDPRQWSYAAGRIFDELYPKMDRADQAQILVRLLRHTPRPVSSHIITALDQARSFVGKTHHFGASSGEIVARLGEEFHKKAERFIPLTPILDLGLVAFEARQFGIKDEVIVQRVDNLLEERSPCGDMWGSGTVHAARLAIPRLCHLIGPATIPCLQKEASRLATGRKHFYFVAACAEFFPLEFKQQAEELIRACKEKRISLYEDEDWRDVAFSKYYAIYGDAWVEEQTRKAFRRRDTDSRVGSVRDEVGLNFIRGLLERRKFVEARAAVRDLYAQAAVIEALRMIAAAPKQDLVEQLLGIPMPTAPVTP